MIDFKPIRNGSCHQFRVVSATQIQQAARELRLRLPIPVRDFQATDNGILMQKDATFEAETPVELISTKIWLRRSDKAEKRLAFPRFPRGGAAENPSLHSPPVPACMNDNVLSKAHKLHDQASSAQGVLGVCVLLSSDRIFLASCKFATTHTLSPERSKTVFYTLHLTGFFHRWSLIRPANISGYILLCRREPQSMQDPPLFRYCCPLPAESYPQA